MNSFLKGNISTGFLPLEKIWDELQSTPIGTEVHVVDKTNGFVHHKGALDSLTSNSFLLKVTQNESHVTPRWGRRPRFLVVSAERSHAIRACSRAYQQLLVCTNLFLPSASSPLRVRTRGCTRGTCRKGALRLRRHGFESGGVFARTASPPFVRFFTIWNFDHFCPN